MHTNTHEYRFGRQDAQKAQKRELTTPRPFNRRRRRPRRRGFFATKDRKVKKHDWPRTPKNSESFRERRTDAHNPQKGAWAKTGSWDDRIIGNPSFRGRRRTEIREHDDSELAPPAKIRKEPGNQNVTIIRTPSFSIRLPASRAERDMKVTENEPCYG
jgi:hypothetical protein